MPQDIVFKEKDKPIESLEDSCNWIPMHINAILGNEVVDPFEDILNNNYGKKLETKNFLSNTCYTDEQQDHANETLDHTENPYSQTQVSEIQSLPQNYSIQTTQNTIKTQPNEINSEPISHCILNQIQDFFAQRPVAEEFIPVTYVNNAITKKSNNPNKVTKKTIDKKNLQKNKVSRDIKLQDANNTSTTVYSQSIDQNQEIHSDNNFINHNCFEINKHSKASNVKINHFDNFNELLASSELKNYLPKKVYNKEISIAVDYCKYLQDVYKEGEINYYNNLNNEQKHILSHLDHNYFPRTLNPKFREFVNTQTFKHIDDILYRCNIRIVPYIPVFIPLQCYISSENYNNQEFISQQITYTDNLKINYIITSGLYFTVKNNTSDSNNNIEFVFACLNKLGEKHKPEIFVCIPDTFINDNMEICSSLQERNIRCLFYHEICDFIQFPYGLYKVTIDRVLNSYGLKYSNNIKTFITKEKIQKLNVIQQFKELDNAVKRSISALNNSFRKRAKLVSKNMAKIVEDHILEKRQKLIDEQSTYFNSLSKKNNNRIFTNNQYAEMAFTDIAKKMSEKYDQEKLHGCCYSVDEMLKYFDRSAFSKVLDRDLFDRIVEDLNTNIKPLSPENELTEPGWGVVLIPLKYCNRRSDVKKRYSKLSSLLNAKVSRHYYVKLYKTKEKHNLDKNRVLVALTAPLPVSEAMEDEQIIALLPHQFDSDCRPLYDPNQFLVRAFFYSEFEKKDVDYCLYEFNTHENHNIKYRDGDSSRQAYIEIRPNINKLSLKNYLLQSGLHFDNRARNKAVKRQNTILID